MNRLDASKAPRWRVVVRAGILLGLVLLVAGFIVRDIRGRAFVEEDYIAWALWGLGAALTAGGVGLEWRNLLSLLKGRRAAERLNFGLVVLLTLAMAGLVCYISTRRFTRMDWTGGAEHRLHSQTENILDALDSDVRAVVIYRSMEPWDVTVFGWVYDMLEEFRSRSAHVQVETIDLNAADSQRRLDELLTRLGVQDLVAPCVVMVTEGTHQVIPFEKMIQSGLGPMAPPDEFSGEAAFSGALIKLTEQHKAVVYALTGHGEQPLEPQSTQAAGTASRSLSRVVQALERDLYEVKPLNLALEGRVPEDCAALIIAGPRAPLQGAEITAIREYLDERGGSALIMADSRYTPGVETNVAELLEPYGIRVHDEAVGVNPQLYLTGAVLRGVAEAMVPVDTEQLPQHPAATDVRFYNVILEQPCPLEITEPQPRAGLRTRPLLTGIPSSWAETDFESVKEGRAEFEPAEDVARPVVLGALVEPQKPSSPAAGMEPAEGPRIVVLGSSGSFLDHVVQMVRGNLFLITNSINWMAGRTHMLGIPPKSMELDIVPVSFAELLAGRYVFIGALPVATIVLGIAVWLTRRR